MITIKPYGGLGNRIRAVDSVIGIYEKNKFEFNLIWERTPTLNCDIEDLFILPDFINLIKSQSRRIKNDTNHIKKILSS